MSFKKSLLCASMILLLVQLSYAQMPGISAPGKMPEMFGEFKMPEVGTYAEYKSTYLSGKVESIVKMSIVGKEKSSEGKELFWYEYQTEDPKTGNVDIVKMLVSGDPQKEGNIRRMIFKHNKDKAMELPAEMIQMINAPMEKEKKATEEKGEVKKLGMETLDTPSGKLECTHLQYVSEKKEISDIWQSNQIPFFGLAKSVAKEMSMEIQKFGKDAKSAITEEPEELRIPGMEEMELPKPDSEKVGVPKILKPPK
jgi:hypothetical protein